MFKVPRNSIFLPAVLLFVSTIGFAQGFAQAPAPQPDQSLKQPIDVDDNFLQGLGAKPQFGIEAEKTAMAMSEAAKQAQQQNRISSVPTFTKSFTFQGQSFPFTMVGRAPERGATTKVETQLIPISMFFEGFADKQGNADANQKLSLARAQSVAAELRKDGVDPKFIMVQGGGEPGGQIASGFNSAATADRRVEIRFTR